MQTKLYEVLARDISNSILSGSLRQGDRLPSVRRTCSIRDVSPATVFRAYYLLEAQGLIESRERFGYFVAVKGSLLPEPQIESHPETESRPIAPGERVCEVIESTMRRDIVPFGSAFPSPLLFPLAQLGAIMGSVARTLDPWASIDDLTPGNAQLRRQLALRYMIDGLSVHADNIIITNGALEALNLCLSSVTRPGDSVLIEAPSFYGSLQAIERQGLEAVVVPAHPGEGMDLVAAERAIERFRPKACWIMTNFQNPLGSLMPKEKKRDLVRLLSRYEIPLIEDDVYGELYFGDKRPAPAKSFDSNGLVMHCSSFSKCLAPGYRVGWVAAGRFAQQVARQKLASTLTTCAPAQAALARYLEKGGYDRHLRILRFRLETQQRQFLEAIARYFPSGTRVTQPQGGYFLWMELPAGVNAQVVTGAALKQGISVAPGPIFSEGPEFSNFLRLNYGHLWDQRAETALATLGKIVTSLLRHK